jgi:hypothetical protein
MGSHWRVSAPRQLGQREYPHGIKGVVKSASSRALRGRSDDRSSQITSARKLQPIFRNRGARGCSRLDFKTDKTRSDHFLSRGRISAGCWPMVEWALFL